MITTEETIEISETTTSYRVAITDVNTRETLDERYQRHREVAENKEQPTQPSTPA